MKNSYLFSLLYSLALVLSCTQLFAEVAEPGKTYQSGTFLEAPEFGFSFTIPKNWQGQLPPDQAIFVLSSPSHQGNIFLSLEQLNAEQVKRAMTEPSHWGNIQMIPARKVAVRKNWYNMDYEVKGSQIPISAYAQTVVGNQGYSLLILALDEPKAMSGVKKSIDELSRSINWQPPKTTIAKPSARQLTQYLSNRKLIRLYTGSGYREKETINLCNNKRFVRYFESGGFGGGVSMVSQDNNQGTWTTSGSQQNGQLTLQYDDASVSQYSLEVKKDGVYLNGSRFFRDGSADC